MLIKDLLNFQLPQSRELFSGRFMIGVHLANAQIIAEQNDMQRVLYPLASFDHFAQVTNKLDLLLHQRFPFRQDAQKPLLFGTGAAEVLDQEV